MNWIQKLLNSEEISYTSQKLPEQVTQSLEELFQKSSLRMGGKLQDDSSFTAYDSLNVVGWNMPNMHRKSAYIRGTIEQTDAGSLIRLQVKPNTKLPLYALLCILVGGVLAFISYSKPQEDSFLWLLGGAFMALGIVYYPASILFRNRLRNRLVKYLDLQKA